MSDTLWKAVKDPRSKISVTLACLGGVCMCIDTTRRQQEVLLLK